MIRASGFASLHGGLREITLSTFKGSFCERLKGVLGADPELISDLIATNLTSN